MHSTFAFSKLVLKNNVFIENVNTFHLQLVNGDITTGEISVETSLVLGEHEASRDCTDQHEKKTSSKKAIFSCVGLLATNDSPFEFPTMGWHKIMGDSARGNVCKFTSVTFKDFPGTGTRCNARPVRVF